MFVRSEQVYFRFRMRAFGGGPAQAERHLVTLAPSCARQKTAGQKMTGILTLHDHIRARERVLRPLQACDRSGWWW